MALPLLTMLVQQTFIPNLKKHLLPRILNTISHEPSSRCSSSAVDENGNEAWTSVSLHNERIYSHQIMRIQYMTYDDRQADDIIRVKAEPNIIVLEDPSSVVADCLDKPPY